jgi:hypothetical protein
MKKLRNSGPLPRVNEDRNKIVEAVYERISNNNNNNNNNNIEDSDVISQKTREAERIVNEVVRSFVSSYDDLGRATRRRMGEGQMELEIEKIVRKYNFGVCLFGLLLLLSL